MRRDFRPSSVSPRVLCAGRADRPRATARRALCGASAVLALMASACHRGPAPDTEVRVDAPPPHGELLLTVKLDAARSDNWHAQPVHLANNQAEVLVVNQGDTNAAGLLSINCGNTQHYWPMAVADAQRTESPPIPAPAIQRARARFCPIALRTSACGAACVDLPQAPHAHLLLIADIGDPIRHDRWYGQLVQIDGDRAQVMIVNNGYTNASGLVSIDCRRNAHRWLMAAAHGEMTDEPPVSPEAINRARARFCPAS